MLRRIVPAVFATAIVAVSLTACSSSDAVEVNRGDCTAMLGAGAVTENVVLLGGYGEDPQISIPAETEITVTQRSIVDSSGAVSGTRVADEGSLVSVNYALYDQQTGEQLIQSDGFGNGDSNEFFIISAEAANPLSEALRCTVAGERVVLAISPGDAAGLSQQLGGTEDAGVIAVFDVSDVSGQSVEGRALGLPNGFPAVVTDANGQPGVVLPPRDAPVGSTSAVRIAGDGAEVHADSRVLVQVLIVGWDGNIVSNTWGQSGPQMLQGEEEATAGGVNFRSELTGKKAGSQVVITEGGDDARVIVVDILAVG
ncbi:peptidylprolyl isomerase [Leucobacter denitrificans]|uniref:Peptidylprolyl isomerase n=1 Tax=Leucobacter denitrificans TaxID=683042 RepID=A0A7G9S5X6_9MICO|nr:peptidylprolyl isomerase [Leucobacter denitrificans]QNN63251.1 peptidylprolyl isomerase [Leucobacter denitrificans]